MPFFCVGIKSSPGAFKAPQGKQSWKHSVQGGSEALPSWRGQVPCWAEGNWPLERGRIPGPQGGSWVQPGGGSAWRKAAAWDVDGPIWTRRAGLLGGSQDWRKLWRLNLTVVTGLSWGLPKKMKTPFLPTGPQQIRSEMASQLLAACGQPSGLRLS